MCLVAACSPGEVPTSVEALPVLEPKSSEAERSRGGEIPSGPVIVALGGDVRVRILALGGNDGLRGLPVDQMKQNLAEIVTLAKGRGIEVLLAGMEAPPNFGSRYTNDFRAVFQELADEHDLVFMPFLLNGVAGDPRLNQDDGIHPNVDGAAIVARRVREAIDPLLGELGETAP